LEIGLTFFQEIGFAISWKNPRKSLSISLSSPKGRTAPQILPKTSPISSSQKSISLSIKHSNRTKPAAGQGVTRLREDRPPSMGSPDAALPRRRPRPSLFQWPLRYPKGREKSTSLCPVITGKTGPLGGKMHYFYTLEDPLMVLPNGVRAPVAARCAEGGRQRLLNAPVMVFPGPVIGVSIPFCLRRNMAYTLGERSGWKHKIRTSCS
jgi:hypothetical protein